MTEYAPPPVPPQVIPYQAPPEARPAAPQMLGIIGIIFASVSTLNHGLGLIILPMVQRRAVELGLSGLAIWWPVVDSVVSLALAAWLLFAAISLLRWSPAARGRMIAWASMHLAWLLVHAVVHVGFILGPTVRAQLATTGQTAQLQAAMIGAYVAAGITLFLIAVYPVVVLVLLNQRRVRDALAGNDVAAPTPFA